MLTVILHQIHHRLRKLLTQGAAPFPVLCAQTEQLSLRGDFPGLLVVAGTEHLRLTFAKQPVAVIARRPEELPESLDCAQIVAVIDSANPALREAIALRKIPALTCGRSETDTFTLSSLTADSAVISLGRPISAFDHSWIDPFELPVTLTTPIDPFELLACAAVFCLLGQNTPLLSQKKWNPFSEQG